MKKIFATIGAAVDARPGVVTTAALFGIGLAITVVVGSVVGVFDHGHTAFAIGSWSSTGCTSGVHRCP